MMTSSNETIFRVTGPLCGEFTGPGEFPTQKPVTRSFDVFVDLRLNKRLSKQPSGWWFETPSWSLWCQCNVPSYYFIKSLNPSVVVLDTFVFFNSSAPGQNGHHFADDIFKCVCVNEDISILIQISLKFVPKGLIYNKAALVQAMAWRRTGDKPLPEPMLIQFTGAYMRH